MCYTITTHPSAPTTYTTYRRIHILIPLSIWRQFPLSVPIAWVPNWLKMATSVRQTVDLGDLEKEKGKRGSLQYGSKCGG